MREIEIDLELAIQEGSRMGGLYMTLWVLNILLSKANYMRTCIGGQKQREIDFELAINEGSSMGDYI